MEAKTLINFSCTVEKKSSYTTACKDLGVSVSDVCRRALDNAISLSQKLKTPAPAPSMDAIIKDNRRAMDTLSGVKGVADTPPKPLRNCDPCPHCGLAMIIHDGSGFCPAGTEEGGGLR